MKYALLLNLLSLCISTCINYSMTSCKQAYQASAISLLQKNDWCGQPSSLAAMKWWNNSAMVCKCVDRDACLKILSNTLELKKNWSVYKTQDSIINLALVGCYYDLAPGRYRTIVWENAVKVIFTITSTEITSITVFILMINNLIIFSNALPPDDCSVKLHRILVVCPVELMICIDVFALLESYHWPDQCHSTSYK